MVLGFASGRRRDSIGAEHLQPGRSETAMRPQHIPLDDGFHVLREFCSRAEADLIRRAIQAWPQLSNHEIAERLGTNRRILELRMKEHGIRKKDIPLS